MFLEVIEAKQWSWWLGQLFGLPYVPMRTEAVKAKTSLFSCFAVKPLLMVLHIS